MDRRDFIKTCGLSCISFISIGTLVEGCAPAKNITGKIVDSDIVFPSSDFVIEKNGEKKYRKNIIVHNNRFQFPICVFRTGEYSYSALLMRCPHQGAELQVFGDKLQCPAHGAEFDNKGTVLSPPADSNLRIFPVKEENNNIIISLK